MRPNLRHALIVRRRNYYQQWDTPLFSIQMRHLPVIHQCRTTWPAVHHAERNKNTVEVRLSRNHNSVEIASHSGIFFAEQELCENGELA